MDQPTIGHNSASYLQMIEKDPGIIFRDEAALEALQKELRAEIESAEIDLSTDKGRKAIASRAAQIARRKTAIDNAGKDLNEEHRKAINAVDAVRRTVRDQLDDLRDLARKPLDEWEQKQKQIQHLIDEIERKLGDYCVVPMGTTSTRIQEMIVELTDLIISEDRIGPRAQTLSDERDQVVEKLTDIKARVEKEEAEKAELERLRAEREEAERAQREAEAKAQREQEEKERAERVAKDAAEKAAEAERRRAQQEAEEKAREHEANLIKERQAREEAERKIREREEQEAKERQEQERREANKRHRAKVMRGAKEALMTHGDIDEESAKKIVLAIIGEQIPNVRLTY